MLFLIEGKVEEELLRLTLLRAPYEACGIISSNGRQVIEVPNLNAGVEGHFKASRENILSALNHLEDEDLSDLTFFHTHPGGGVGPSRMDIVNKSPFPNHLVVTLIEGDIVPTWY